MFSRFVPRVGLSSQAAARLQYRSVFVIAESTPNPESIMFYPQGKSVLGENAKTKSYDDRHMCGESPLASALFKIQGINTILLGQRHITVTKGSQASWDYVKPSVELVVSQFFAAQIPPIDPKKIEFYEAPASRTADASAGGLGEGTIDEQINDLLIQRVVPFVQQDGGDIKFIRYEDNVVYLQLQGACSGCPKSSITLQFQIKNLLQHFFPEIKEVVGIDEHEGEEAEIPRGH